MKKVYVAVAVLLTATQAKALELNPVTVNLVLKTNVTSVEQPIVLPQRDVHVVVSNYEIQPGAKLAEHKHEFARYGYVLAGRLRVTNTETGKSLDFKAGDFILEALGQWHRGGNVGPDVVKLLVIDQVEGDTKNVTAR